MEYITQNMAEALIVLGLLVLVVEVLVLGFSTFFLFFLGMGFVATGMLLFTGLFDSNLTNISICVALVSGISAILLWQPLKNIQNKVDTSSVKNDLIGYQFRLQENLEEGKTINHQYSGITWKISSEQSLSSGENVEVVAISVGKMQVKRCE